MSKTETAVEQAQAAIVALGQREIELLAQRRAKAADIAAAEQEAGEAFLDAEAGSTAPGAAVETVLRLKAELSAFDRGLDVCHRRRLEAIKRKWEAEAGELREQAATAQRELEALEAKTAPHLAALSKIEGVPFTGVILRCEPDGMGGLHVPRSVALQAQLDELPSRILGVERRAFPTSGLIETEGTGIESLLSGLVALEGETPRIGDVLDWAAAVEGHAGPFGERFRRYRLAWGADGQILRDSFIDVPELASRFRRDSHTGELYADSTSGIFKAAESR
jgi:hypothetical protein